MAEITLTKDNFEAEVLKSDIPVVVDFWATWCGPCQMMGPIIEKFAEEFEGTYKVGKVNVDDEEELAEEYGIMSIPSIKIFKNGENVKSVVGVQSREKLLDLLK
ncbi:MAG: thioredoxin [Lachnospiraceae bacterium]|nr:thioredoxin [Lachnospiraceae bacterium]